jgi:nicotinamide-nucleotide amidase
MAQNNLRQAKVPVGATIIHNDRGTAPGLICPVGNKVVYAVPGVPHEMRNMVEATIIPDILKRSGNPRVIFSRVLRTWGESESALNERLQPVIDDLEQDGNPTLAFLASGWEGIKVRLTASGASEAEARHAVQPWEARIRDLVGDIVFGVDDDTMESVVLDLLKQRGLTLGLAESVTGGLVAGRVTNVPGASRVFRGSIVSYASEVKFALFDVDEGPVVSARAAEQMARGAREVLKSDIGLSLTGVAGPEEQDGQPVGTLFIGIAFPDGSTRSTQARLPGQRDQMRQLSVITALDYLRRSL